MHPPNVTAAVRSARDRSAWSDYSGLPACLGDQLSENSARPGWSETRPLTHASASRAIGRQHSRSDPFSFLQTGQVEEETDRRDSSVH